MDKIKLDGRLGFSLEIFPEQLEILTGNDRLAAKKLLVELVQSEQCHIVGDTYFPVDWNEEVLDGVDENNLEFDLPEITVGKENINKMEIDLGYATLVAEKGADTNFKEIFVGLNDKEGNFLQELAVVGGAHHIEGDSVVYEKGVSVKVYSDKDDEDYTHEFSVGIYELEKDSPTVDDIINTATEKSKDVNKSGTSKDDLEFGK